MQVHEPQVGDERQVGDKREAGWLLVLFALFGGLTAWTVHLVALAALVAPACSHGLTWVQHAVTVATAAITLASMAAGLRLIPQTTGGGPAASPSRAAPSIERSHILGFLAVIFGAASLLLIILEGVPVLVLDACRYT